MAERLTGQSRSVHILSDLYRNNNFTERRHGSGLTYQYHSLFREFLQSRAECTYSHSELTGLRHKAAQLLEESGNIEDAVKLYLKTGDWEGLTGLIMKHARELLIQGRNQVLEEWLRHLPEGVMENNPWLLYWMGVSLLPFNQAESRGYLEKAFEVFHGQRDAAGVFLSWSSIVQSLVFGFESVKLHDKWIALLDKLIPEFGRVPPGEIETSVASSMFSALVMSQPGHAEFSKWRKRALTLAARSADINLRINTLFQLVGYFQYKGDFTKAALILEQLKVLSRSRAITPFGLIIIKTAEVMQYNFTAEHKQCLKAAEEGLNLANQAGVHTFDVTINGYVVWSSIGMHDFATARKYLEQMELFVGKTRLFDSCFYNFLKGFEELEKGNLPSALERAEQTLALDHQIGAISTKPNINFQYAQIRHELGDHKGAMQHLLTARNGFKEFKGRVFEFMCLLGEAQFALGRGEEKEALEPLRRAMAIGREHGYVHTYLWRPSVMSDLCVKALEAGIEVEYVKELIRKRNLVPKTPPVHIEEWPWAVKIYTLGRFDLVIEGKPDRSLGKVQKKPFKMLKALIALGGRAVSEAQLSDSLWPEADGDMAHKSFATTLHRLRRLLGNERAIKFQDDRVTLDQHYCWVDLWALERMFGEAVAVTEGDTGEKIQSIKKAIGMYRGPFLDGDEAEFWTVSRRERLRSKFLRYVDGVGKYHELNGQWKEAVECYRKALEVDDLAENFYQRLMICYARLNCRSEALAVYERCRRTITSTLGIEPSPETEKIRQSLLSWQR
jgi:two-component SAPR family response regulator